jgi:hypothetical protein
MIITYLGWDITVGQLGPGGGCLMMTLMIFNELENVPGSLRLFHIHRRRGIS